VGAAAIDFGGTITDVVVRRRAKPDLLLALPSVRRPDVDAVAAILDAATGREPAEAREGLELVAVTGGRSRELPERCGEIPIVKIDESSAIAQGGLHDGAPAPAIVVSLGTGTALVLADPASPPRHLVGSGIGGGTLVGLGRLLLDTDDVEVIGRLSSSGDASRCDLRVGDILGGGIGIVPAEATAAHFARLARREEVVTRPAPADIAAALVNLVGQAALRLAFEAALGHRARSIVLLGHVLDVPGFRESIARIPLLDPSFVRCVDEPGFAVARGALTLALGATATATG
jgi:type II pantothenate kinase